jgi:hypothetical protein
MGDTHVQDVDVYVSPDIIVGGNVSQNTQEGFGAMSFAYDVATKPSFNVYRRWGIEISKAGYTAGVPNYLVYANLFLEADLKITPSEYWLLNIVLSCWRETGKPQASKKFIASRMGVSERQVQRVIRSLERKFLVLASSHHDRPHRANEFDLSGLMTFLKYVWRMKEENKQKGMNGHPTVRKRDLSWASAYDNSSSEESSS